MDRIRGKEIARSQGKRSPRRASHLDGLHESCAGRQGPGRVSAAARSAAKASTSRHYGYCARGGRVALAGYRSVLIRANLWRKIYFLTAAKLSSKIRTASSTSAFEMFSGGDMR